MYFVPARTTGIAVLLLLATTHADTQEKKLPVPEAADQKKAEAEVRGAFKDDFAKKDREGRRALGQKLLAQASDAANTLAQRYAALILTRDVSAEAFDFKTGLAAIDSLERDFDVRPAPLAGATFTINLNLLKASYLIAARKFAATPEDISLIAGWFMTLAEGAMKSTDFDDAAAFADQAAKASRDPSVVAKARQFVQEMPFLKAEKEAAIKAAAALAKNPDDPDANTVLGKYLLFSKKDESGLSSLSKGSASPLRDLATSELANPASPEAMLEVGEGWLTLSEKEKNNLGRSRYQERAISWLERAFQNSGGLTKAKIKKRLGDLGRIEEPSADALLCRWFFDEGKGAGTQDSSPAARKGTLMNGVRWVNGVSGSAVSFDGAGSYISCDAKGLHFADNPQSIVWAHNAGAAPKGSTFIIALTAEKSTLILGLGYRDGKVSVWTTNMTLVQAPAPAPGEWHFFAYTYDQKTHKLYVDGVQKGSSTVGTMAGQYQMLEFGRWYGGNGNPNQFFNGSLDDVRIYRRALEEGEVRDLVRRRR